MSAKTAIIAGRKAAEALMTDHATITRPTVATGPDGLDQVTETPAANAAGALVTIQRYSIHLPHHVDAVRVGDLIRVAGYLSVFRVTGLFDKTHVTSRRFQVDVETNGDDLR